jgi:4-amino-4-deoxy-L-arabinose transferase-like glycosyltransferase
MQKHASFCWMRAHWQMILLWTLVVCASSFVFFFRLNQAPVESWDEGFYALMAHDSGAHPLMPSIYGELWFEKPPLGVWIMASSFNIFGVNAWALRLPSALFAFVAMLLFFDLARRCLNKWSGVLATLFFVTSPVLIMTHMARSGDMDTMLLFSSIGLMWTYVRAWKDERWWLAVAAFLGVGFLLRGSPMLIQGFVLVLHALIFRLHPSKKIFWLSLGLLALLILPWHIAALILYGRPFFDGYILHGLLGRIDGVVEGHAGPWNFYDVGYLRWRLGSLAFVGYAGAFLATSYALRKRDKATALFVLWFLIPFVILSCMQTKLYWYIMPVLPPLILCGTFFLSQFAIRLVRERTPVIRLVIIIFFGSIISLIWRGCRVSFSTILHPAPAPFVATLAENLSHRPALPAVWYDPNLRFLLGRFEPREEWYLNMRKNLDVGYVDRPALSRWFDQDPRTFRLILPTSEEAIIASSTSRVLEVEGSVGSSTLLRVRGLSS